MRLLSYLLLCLCFFSCQSGNTPPDVSNIKLNLKTTRFEKDFFAMDSAKIPQQLDSVIDNHGEFGTIFMTQILNADPRWSEDTMRMYLGGFINSYKPMYAEAQKLFSDFNPYENQIRQALQYVKYYFGDYLAKNKNYRLPERIITYIGPIDGYGDNLIPGDAFVVGLHHHLGDTSTFYNSEMLNQTYPQYITHRFTPLTIVINAMNRLLNDMFPPKYAEETLVNQMIESGKRYFVLQKLMPDKKPEMLFGFDYNQFVFCETKEAYIWNFFVQNALLQSKEANIIRNYIGDSPKTQEFGDESPGNIGSYIGWKIVSKYMSEQKEMNLYQLMNTPADEILSKAKYKP